MPKKIFLKPQMKRINIDFSENIATSIPDGPQGTAGAFSLNWTDRFSCYVYTSSFYLHEITEANYMSTFPCLVSGISPQSAARTLGISMY